MTENQVAQQLLKVLEQVDTETAIPALSGVLIMLCMMRCPKEFAMTCFSDHWDAIANDREPAMLH